MNIFLNGIIIAFAGIIVYKYFYDSPGAISGVLVGLLFMFFSDFYMYKDYKTPTILKDNIEKLCLCSIKEFHTVF